MNTTIYTIAIAVLGCGVVCGSDHIELKGDKQKSFMNVLRPLAMVNTKERYKRTLNKYSASSYLRQQNLDIDTVDFYRPEISKRSFGLKTRDRYKRMTSAENLEDIFGTFSMDRKKQHENDLQSYLSKDPVLSANIEHVLGMASNTLDDKRKEYTIPNPLINVEPQLGLEKYTADQSSDERITNPPQKTNLNSIIKQLYGPEIRPSYPETNDIENKTGDATPKTPNRANDLESSKPSLVVYVLYSLISVLLLL